MHDIGDLMLNLDFIDSVVDTEKIIIQYESIRQLQKDLKILAQKSCQVKTNQKVCQELVG